MFSEGELWLTVIVVVRRFLVLAVVAVVLLVVGLDILGVSPMAMEQSLPILRLLLSVGFALGGGLDPIGPTDTGDP